MAAKRPMPPLETLAHYLEATTESPSGLIWKKREDIKEPSWNTKWANKSAGSKGEKHWQISFLGKRWRAHRILWVLLNGSIPQDMEVDHKDGDGFNNHPDNLRLVTPSQNAHNQVARKGQFKNVCFVRAKMKYRVQVWKNCKAYFGGYFDTESDAAKAASALREKLHGIFANHQSARAHAVAAQL